jgi:hypothetical protein
MELVKDTLFFAIRTARTMIDIPITLAVINSRPR